MVKMSALKGIRSQYRLRVRYRLVVLAYAIAEGPTAAARRYGVCVRTVIRWRVRWRRDGLAGLEPRYPRRRASSKRRAVLEHIRYARESGTAAPARMRSTGPGQRESGGRLRHARTADGAREASVGGARPDEPRCVRHLRGVWRSDLDGATTRHARGADVRPLPGRPRARWSPHGSQSTQRVRRERRQGNGRGEPGVHSRVVSFARRRPRSAGSRNSEIRGQLLSTPELGAAGCSMALWGLPVRHSSTVRGKVPPATRSRTRRHREAGAHSKRWTIARSAVSFADDSNNRCRACLIARQLARRWRATVVADLPRSALGLVSGIHAGISSMCCSSSRWWCLVVQPLNGRRSIPRETRRSSSSRDQERPSEILKRVRL
jgi:Winged helix-turn helix